MNLALIRFIIRHILCMTLINFKLSARNVNLFKNKKSKYEI